MDYLSDDVINEINNYVGLRCTICKINIHMMDRDLKLLYGLYFCGENCGNFIDNAMTI